MKEQVETVREEQFVEDIFGINSKLANAEWLAAITAKAAYIFDTAEMRNRLLKAAEIEVKHNNAAPGQ